MCALNCKAFLLICNGYAFDSPAINTHISVDFSFRFCFCLACWCARLSSCECINVIQLIFSFVFTSTFWLFVFCRFNSFSFINTNEGIFFFSFACIGISKSVGDHGKWRKKNQLLMFFFFVFYLKFNLKSNIDIILCFSICMRVCIVKTTKMDYRIGNATNKTKN